jgi:coenzyme F420 hydrogenase subunit beta
MNDSPTLPSEEMIPVVDKGNGRKLCSLCGLCMVKAWPAKEGIEGCVFTLGWLGDQEMKVFGRERSKDNYDEMLFGISREQFIARMKNPLSTGQFIGIITNIAKKAFEIGLVDAVVTLHRSKDDYLYPQAVLARSPEIKHLASMS